MSSTKLLSRIFEIWIFEMEKIKKTFFTGKNGHKIQKIEKFYKTVQYARDLDVDWTYPKSQKDISIFGFL